MAKRTPARRWLIRWLAYPPQAVGAWILYGLLRLMPVGAASAFGGGLLRLVGPLLGAHRIARDNLQRAFPEKTATEVARILRDVWDNLGRVLGEWPHLNHLYQTGFDGRVEVIGGAHLDRIRETGGPAIIITGHHGNWELVGAVSAAHGMPLKVIYRPAQNPWVNPLVLLARRRFTGGLLPKGKDAATGALAHLKAGGHLGVLIDQKLNRGTAVPFLGRDAMTSPVAARLAVGFRCPVIAIRAERKQGARYTVTIYPPMEIPETGDRKRDRDIMLLEMNRMLEGWVRERPDQWFWVHKRWPD